MRSFSTSYASLARFEGGEAEFRTWTFTIAHRRLLDQQRRRCRQPCEPVAAEALAAAAPCGDVEADALRPLMEADALRLLDALSDDQRDVLLLRILIGFSIAETARVLGKRPGAVKSLQLRGLAALRKQLVEGAVSFAAPQTINEVR